MEEKIERIKDSIERNMETERQNVIDQLNILKSQAEKIDTEDLLGAMYIARRLYTVLDRIERSHIKINDLMDEQMDLDFILKEN